MDERKIKVLMAVIHSYISSPMAVGSRTLSKEYDLGVSSATIRNEMSDLEDLGYLIKPHTSSGRIPSDKAFRFYVNELLSQVDLSLGQEKKERTLPLDLVQGTEEFYEGVAKNLADLTKSMVYIVTPKKRDTSIHLLDLLLIEERLALVIVVGNQGVVERTLLPLEEPMTEEDLSYIADRLRKALIGLDFEQISNLKLKLSPDMVPYQDFILKVIETLAHAVYKVDEIDIYESGLINLLNYEEFQDIQIAQEIMSYMSEKDNVLKIISQIPKGEDLHILIGSENPDKILRTSSILATDYQAGDQSSGRIALIGPVRMDYRYLVRTLIDFSKELSWILGG
ncbi:MAG: heat-inducible transcriptional repressor HrcA [Tissierellia bacterium]|nr:heat-inducible transcriptional repressor HrcA [Tissierellia bacterium]